MNDLRNIEISASIVLDNRERMQVWGTGEPDLAKAFQTDCAHLWWDGQILRLDFIKAFFGLSHQICYSNCAYHGYWIFDLMAL